MSFRLSTGLRNAMLGTGGFSGAFDSGALYIYSGAIPTDADTTEGSGTLLLTITVASAVMPGGGISYATPAGGSITKAAEVWSGVAGASGTAAWFRLYDSNETTGASTTAVRLDGTVGTSNADLLVTSTSISSGATTTIDSAEFTLPATV